MCAVDVSTQSVKRQLWELLLPVVSFFFTNKISNIHFKYVLRSIIKYSSIKEKYAKLISKKEVRQAGKPGFGRHTYMIHKDAVVCLYFERVFYVADLSG